MKTLGQFIREHGLTMIAEPTNGNPYMENGADMDHWRCVIRAGRRKLTIPFSMGKGHNGKAPDLPNVLDCLASDSAGIETAGSFEDWASEYGYDTDSRKAERTFRACQRQADKLKRFLTEGAYQELLFDTER